MIRHRERLLDDIHVNETVSQTRMTAFILAVREEGDRATQERAGEGKAETQRKMG